MTTEHFWSRVDRLKLHHVLFWAVYYLFWVSMYRFTYQNLFDICLVTSVYLVFNAACFYSVAYWVGPKFFSRRRYFLALLFFVIILAATSAGLAGSLVQTMHLLGVEYPVPFTSLLGFTAISNVTVLVIALALRQLTGRLRADRHATAVRGKQTEAELQYLKAQVNPHFLFNAINSVYFLIKKDPDLASATLIKLSDLLRFQLYDCTEDAIPIEKEREYLENFMALETLRKGKRVSLDYRTEGNLHGFHIAPLVLIAFLENAFKFVSNYTDRENIIRVVLQRQDNQFRALFYNTYEPLPPTAVGGIGIRNVKRRLELLYPEHTLDVMSEHDSYTVTLTIPIA
jgi:two-component system, LytTR family, sensor kinase